MLEPYLLVYVINGDWSKINKYMERKGKLFIYVQGKKIYSIWYCKKCLRNLPFTGAPNKNPSSWPIHMCYCLGLQWLERVQDRDCQFFHAFLLLPFWHPTLGPGLEPWNLFLWSSCQIFISFFLGEPRNLSTPNLLHIELQSIRWFFSTYHLIMPPNLGVASSPGGWVEYARWLPIHIIGEKENFLWTSLLGC